MWQLNFIEFIYGEKPLLTANSKLHSWKEWFLENLHTPRCPNCGGEMVLRTAKTGYNAGKQFYGCRRFPNCKGTLGYKPGMESQPQPTAPSKPAMQPAASANKPLYTYAKIIAKNDFRFGQGKEIAVVKNPNGGWHYITLRPDSDSSASGTIADNEVQSVMQSYRDKNNKPIQSQSPSIEDLNRQLDGDIIDAKPTTPKEQAKSPLIPSELMSKEQKAIDDRFEKLLSEPGQSHIMINALAGSGKTTMLKHLAWKYGNSKQKWLYLVFNTKNKVEAQEKFPPWVQVRTTNGFLGEVLQDRKNAGKMPSTERIVNLNRYGKKEEGGSKLEKARLVVDGDDFAKLMAANGITGETASAGDYGKMANTLNSLMRSIKYEFKEQVLTLAGLAKSFALDPRNDDKLQEGIQKIMNSYDFDTGLSEIKERISKYSGSYGANVQQGLEDLLGYDFMRKNYKDEIVKCATWLLHATMPHGTNQVYSKDRMNYNLGQFRDFNDDLWFAATHADQIQWPKFTVVLADEVQDFNEAQKVMLQKLHEAGAKIVAVGDPNQCHPAGTQIVLTGGELKNIEDVVEGDSVVTYNTKKSYFPGMNAQGRKIRKTAVRNYVGDLIEIKTERGYSHKCTPNHKCLVRLNNDNTKFALYLMVKGHSARIGICRLNYQNGFGVSIRAKQEKADKAYLLNIYDSEKSARIAETVTSYKFGLPQLMFCNNGKCSADQTFIDEVYRQLGCCEQNVTECLTFFGREVEFPIWSAEAQERFGKMKQNYVGSKKSFVTQACNLISGSMQVRTFDGTNRGGDWETITVAREQTNCPVYSLEVEPTEDGKQLYVANGIVTHNSIYRFRGADGKAFGNLANHLTDLSQDKNVVFPLSKNFRSRKAILDYTNQTTHVKNLEQGKQFKDGKEGVVTDDEMHYEDAFHTLNKEFKTNGKVKQTAFIARTNEPLVHAALKLLANGTPFVIVGKDIARDLKKHIGKIMAKFGLRDENSTLDLADKLRGFHDEEQDAHFGKSTKRVYLQELKEVTEALESSLEQFNSEIRNGNIAKFKQWLSQRLGGMDLEENESDIKEFNKKMEEENPVVLTTAHRSKGLEFERVFLLRSDQFPHKKAEREEDLEQEANAKYVALTRAMDELHVLQLKGQPGVKDD